jgi:hypothetical protein
MAPVPRRAARPFPGSITAAISIGHPQCRTISRWFLCSTSFLFADWGANALRRPYRIGTVGVSWSRLNTTDAIEDRNQPTMNGDGPAFVVHRPQGVYAQELGCGGVVLAVVEVVELVAWVTGCGLVVQLAVQPAGAALRRGGTLAVNYGGPFLLSIHSINHPNPSSTLRARRTCS